MVEAMPNSERTKRSVESLQRLYGSAVALALYTAVSKTVVTSSSGTVSLNHVSLIWFIPFLATLLAFYHGALRHLDGTYIFTRPTRPPVLLFDFLLLFIEAGLLVRLAFQISDPAAFGAAYIILLGSDSPMGVRCVVGGQSSIWPSSELAVHKSGYDVAAVGNTRHVFSGSIQAVTSSHHCKLEDRARLRIELEDVLSPRDRGVKALKEGGPEKMKIYLAGPLFTAAELLFNRSLKKLLQKAGHRVWLPQEKEPRRKTAAAIFSKDCRGHWPKPCPDGIPAVLRTGHCVADDAETSYWTVEPHSRCFSG